MVLGERRLKSSRSVPARLLAHATRLLSFSTAAKSEYCDRTPLMCAVRECFVEAQRVRMVQHIGVMAVLLIHAELGGSRVHQKAGYL